MSKDNKRLRERVHILESETDDLYEKMYHLECSVEGANQHNRKNNIEISGLPDVIEDDILESTVVSILNKIVDKPIDASTEVEACHRIRGKRGFKGTLIRFVNRKRNQEQSFKNEPS